MNSIYIYSIDIISEEEPFIDQFFSSVTRKRDRIRSVFGRYDRPKLRKSVYFSKETGASTANGRFIFIQRKNGTRAYSTGNINITFRKKHTDCFIKLRQLCPRAEKFYHNLYLIKISLRIVYKLSNYPPTRSNSWTATLVSHRKTGSLSKSRILQRSISNPFQIFQTNPLFHVWICLVIRDRGGIGSSIL